MTIIMANGKIQQRIDSKLQKEVEGILHAQGIKPSQAIVMLYHEIKRRRGFPFIPSEVPNNELEKDLREAATGKGVDAYGSEKEMFVSLKETK